MTVTVWPARLMFERPLTPLAFEVRASETLPASEPAVAAVRPRLAVWAARRLAGLVRASVPTAEVATTSRLSW